MRNERLSEDEGGTGRDEMGWGRESLRAWRCMGWEYRESF